MVYSGTRTHGPGGFPMNRKNVDDSTLYSIFELLTSVVVFSVCQYLLDLHKKELNQTKRS